MRLLFLITVFLFSTTIINSTERKVYNFFTRWGFTVEEQQNIRLKQMKVKYRDRYSDFYRGDGTLPDSLTLVEELSFDTNGNLYERIILDSYGGIRSKYDFVYDSNNDCISEELSNRSGNVLHRREIKYNSNRDTSEVIYIAQRISRNSKRVFNYDDNNRLTSKLHYDSKDEQFLREEYIYVNGNLSVLEFYNKENNMHHQVSFEYNDRGDIIKETEYGIDKIYYYNEDGQLHKVESTQIKRLYLYDEKGNIIDEQFFVDNLRQFRLTFSYLDNGLLNEIIRYDANDTKMFYSKFNYIFFD